MKFLDWDTVELGFAFGFGLGCGLWMAVRLGQTLDVCLRELQRFIRTGRARRRASRREQHPAVQRPELSGAPRSSNSMVENSADRQPGRDGAQGIVIPLNDGSTVPLEEATYEDIRDAYYADLREAFVQAGEFEEMPGILREEPDFQRIRDRWGSPRAPTVARPPGYPGGTDNLVVELERPVYQVEEQAGAVGGEQSSTDQSESSMSAVGSTTSGGARDLLEVESEATGSRGRSGASNQSTASRVAGMSAFMLTHAQGASLSAELTQDSDWELWFVLCLVVLVSMFLGALGLWVAWSCFASGNHKCLESRNSGESVGEGVGCGVVDMPKDRARQHHQPSSPVINITVTGGVFEGRAQQPATSADVQVPMK